MDCHDRNLGINEDWFTFDFYTLDQHRPLNELDLSKNSLTLLPTNELKNLRYLKKLDLSQNRLDNTHSEILRTLINLEELNYSYNLLWNFDISILNTSLSKLNLTHNRINNLEKSSENATTVLKILDVSHNNITDLVRYIRKLTSQFYISAGDYLYIHLFLFHIFQSFLEALLELEYLDLSFNKLALLPANAFLHLERLKTLYISNNQILSLNLQHIPLSLLELYAGNNVINDLSFQNAPIRILDIQNNRISNIHQNLTSLEELTNLNVSGNLLSDFPGVFLKNLKTLDLSYNELTLIPASISTKNFPNLKNLRLNGNHLKDIKIRSELQLENFEISFAKTIEKIEEGTFLMLRERRTGCINVIISNNIKLSAIHENVFQHMNICSVSIP